jgi:hypothetical protein
MKSSCLSAVKVCEASLCCSLQNGETGETSLSNDTQNKLPVESQHHIFSNKRQLLAPLMRMLS